MDRKEAAATTGRQYPLRRPENDPRFTFGLAIDVARVLKQHGFPEITNGSDFVALEEALFGFLYAKDELDAAFAKMPPEANGWCPHSAQDWTQRELPDTNGARAYVCLECKKPVPADQVRFAFRLDVAAEVTSG